MINVNLTNTMSIYLYSCIDFIVLEYSNTVSTKSCHTHNVQLIDQLSYHRTPYIIANFTEQYSSKIAKREKVFKHFSTFIFPILQDSSNATLYYSKFHNVILSSNSPGKWNRAATYSSSSSGLLTLVYHQTEFHLQTHT